MEVLNTSTSTQLDNLMAGFFPQGKIHNWNKSFNFFINNCKAKQKFL